jgi:hypothetical protein
MREVQEVFGSEQDVVGRGDTLLRYFLFAYSVLFVVKKNNRRDRNERKVGF